MTSINYTLVNPETFKLPLLRIGCLEGSNAAQVLLEENNSRWFVRKVDSLPIPGETFNWMNFEVIIFVPTVETIAGFAKLMQVSQDDQNATFVIELLTPSGAGLTPSQAISHSHTVSYANGASAEIRAMADQPYTFNTTGLTDPQVPTIRYQPHIGMSVVVTVDRNWTKEGLKVREGLQPWFGYEPRNGLWVYADSGAKLVKALDVPELLPDDYYFDLPVLDIQTIPSLAPLSWFIYKRVFGKVSLDVTRALYFPQTYEDAAQIKTLVEYAYQQPSPSEDMLYNKIRELNLAH